MISQKVVSHKVKMGLDGLDRVDLYLECGHVHSIDLFDGIFKPSDYLGSTFKCERCWQEEKAKKK